MKKHIQFVFIMVFTISYLSSAQTVDNILKEHFKVINQDKISNLTSKTTKGILYQNGFEVDLYVAQKRADKMRQVLSFNGQNHTVVFNQNNGWEQNQFAGHTQPQAFNDAQVASIKISANLDSRIKSYVNNNAAFEYIGIELLENEEHYKLKLETQGIGEEHVWINKKTYTLTQIKNIKSNVVTLFKDYKTVNGMLFPHETHIKSPAGEAKIIITSIEFNLDMDDVLFKIKS
ncbi:hypothetical protein [uncultured Psychroserpens sp.]|uniref:hypothetical protein n=1 Tax=uncultured Psychroserpens sp. TaxID=255436 RepID=UPI00263108E7|nr:hypothetical protein [uncultured Psychroserpens sp.]